jgi:hypoxanthine phosphoribosyltransferase
LITRERIARRIREMGERISRDHAEHAPLLMIGLLKGSIIFTADLVRAVTIDVEVDFISISSYSGRSTSSGSVRLLRDLDRDVYGRHVLIVEDIIDSGLSLGYIRGALLARSPRTLGIAALLDKRQRRTTEVPVDYVGFEIPDRFVVGYGLDYLQRYRGLPYVAVLDPEEIAEDEEPGGR